MFRTMRIAVMSLVLSLALLPGAPTQAAPKAGRNIQDVLRLLDQYQPDPAKTAAIAQTLATEPAAGTEGAALAKFYLDRARAAAEAGMIARQIADLRRVAELGGGSAPARAYKELSLAEFQGGDFGAALSHNQEAIRLADSAGKRGQLISDYAFSAEIYRRLGRLEEADRAMRDAENMFVLLRSRSQMWGEMQHNWTAAYQDARGRYLLAAGKPHEAELAFSEAVRERELDMPLNLQRLAKGMDMPPQSLMEQSRDGHELRLAEALMQQGRLYDAEIHTRHVLQRTLSRVGRYSIQTVQAVMQYTRLLLEQRRASEAETLARAAIEILEKIGATPDALFLVNARRQLATSFVPRGQYAKALEQYQAMQASASPEFRHQLAGGDINWALCLVRTGQAEAARAMLEPLLERSVKVTGEKSVQSAELRGYLGLTLAKLGQREKALRALQDAAITLVDMQRQQKQVPSPVRQTRLAIIIDAYIALLAEIRNTPLEKSSGIDAAAESFRLADFAHGQSVQQAVSEAAARNAAGTPELAALIRQVQDLRQEEGSLFKVLVDQMSQPPEKQLTKIIGDMKARIGAIDQERQQLMAKIAREFPAYADLVSPQPASLEQARAVLRPGEALISIVSSENGSYVWAVPQSGPVAFAASKLTGSDIAKIVAKLRASLDTGDQELEKVPEFDLDAGYKLYAELLQPVAPGWQGAKNLLVATGGALSQLPFALLPTAPSKPERTKLLFGYLGQVPWLIRQTAITQIPSVNAMVALRKQKPGSPERIPFIGFGDPDFSGKQLAEAAVAGPTVRGLHLHRLATRAAMENGSEWVDYSRIPPLPDTRDEILSLAKAMGADPGRDVLLGAQASKSNVQKMDLAKRRIVAFATHGLVAGDFPGVDQPSLALANPGDGQNGLLTLEEILGLKLDADWVVLSACNTAAGDGAGAEAVSGLGRGFFYAGSRSLLVTHWPVETVSARLLVTGAFSRYAADPNLSRAEALRQSILALMNSPGAVDPATKQAAFSYAHPMFWAPYALVGDGGAH